MFKYSHLNARHIIHMTIGIFTEHLQMKELTTENADEVTGRCCLTTQQPRPVSNKAVSRDGLLSISVVPQKHYTKKQTYRDSCVATQMPLEAHELISRLSAFWNWHQSSLQKEHCKVVHPSDVTSSLQWMAEDKKLHSLLSWPNRRQHVLPQPCTYRGGGVLQF